MIHGSSIVPPKTIVEKVETTRRRLIGGRIAGILAALCFLAFVFQLVLKDMHSGFQLLSELEWVTLGAALVLLRLRRYLRRKYQCKPVEDRELPVLW